MADDSPIVYVVDDDPSVLKALGRLIRSAGFLVQTFDSARGFLDFDHFEGPCCLILDVQMPDLTGLDLQEELTFRNLSLPIIFLTGHGNIPMSVRAMKAGATDFLTKPCDDATLLKVIYNAIEKDRKAREERAAIDAIQKRTDKLTPRENQVLRLVIGGLLNKQIAYELGISERTVKVHRARVMTKMEADSVAELVRFAEKVGIVPPIVKNF